MTPLLQKITETTTQLNRHLAAVTISIDQQRKSGGIVANPMAEENLRKCLSRLRDETTRYLSDGGDFSHDT